MLVGCMAAICASKSLSPQFTLDKSWHQPYALALAMLSLFGIFIAELIAFRVGNAKLAALGIKHGTSITLSSMNCQSLS